MKIILVTGANRGIGLEISRQLDQLGHTVILGSRDLEKGMAAAVGLSNRVIVKQLDVTDEESIRSLCQFLDSGPGKLDVLVNNAGLGATAGNNNAGTLTQLVGFLDKNAKGIGKMARAVTPLLRRSGIIPQRLEVVEADLGGVKRLMETNFYGAWQTTRILHPLLLKSNEGRIINVSSGNGQLAGLSGRYPGYSLSKASLNALTILLSEELKGKGIKVNAMCPGWVKTDMGGPNAPREVAEGADTAVWLATEPAIPTGKFFRDREIIDW